MCCGRRCGTSGRSCGLCMRSMGLQLPSMCHMCCSRGLRAVCVVVAGVACGVTVFMLCVSWSRVCCVQSWSWVPSLHHMHCGCCLCTVCGVAVALFVLRGVSLVPSLHWVWC